MSKAQYLRMNSLKSIMQQQSHFCVNSNWNLTQHSHQSGFILKKPLMNRVRNQFLPLTQQQTILPQEHPSNHNHQFSRESKHQQVANNTDVPLSQEATAMNPLRNRSISPFTRLPMPTSPPQPSNEPLQSPHIPLLRRYVSEKKFDFPSLESLSMSTANPTEGSSLTTAFTSQQFKSTFDNSNSKNPHRNNHSQYQQQPASHRQQNKSNITSSSTAFLSPNKSSTKQQQQHKQLHSPNVSHLNHSNSTQILQDDSVIISQKGFHMHLKQLNSMNKRTLQNFATKQFQQQQQRSRRSALTRSQQVPLQHQQQQQQQSPAISKNITMQNIDQTQSISISPNRRLNRTSIYLNSSSNIKSNNNNSLSKSPEQPFPINLPLQSPSTSQPIITPFLSPQYQSNNQKSTTFIASNLIKKQLLFTATEKDLQLQASQKQRVSKLFNAIAGNSIPQASATTVNGFLKPSFHLPIKVAFEQQITPSTTKKEISFLPLDEIDRFPQDQPQESPQTTTLTTQNPKGSTNPMRARKEQRLSLHYNLEESVNSSGEITTNSEDKFEFLKSIPIGSHIMVSYIKPSKNLSSPLGSPKASKYSLEQMQNTNFNSARKWSVFSAAKEGSPPISFASQMHSQVKQSNAYVKPTPSPISSFNNLSTSPTLILRNNSFHKRDSRTNSPRNNYNNISNNQINSSQLFMTRMSGRLSQFFKSEKQCPPAQNFIIWKEFTAICRTIKRNIDSLFTIEKNLSKNLKILDKLLKTKPYLNQELIDGNFTLLHQEVIDTLENYMISESFLKKYFTKSDELASIIVNTYLKDLSYFNKQLETYLNSRHITAASKISQEIQTEFAIVKQKEKTIVIDKLKSNSFTPSSGLLSKVLKQKYPFFNAYSYNIHPHRNPYTEIQNLEKSHGPCVHLNPVEREVFLNLEKSYNDIRTANNQF